MMRSINILLLEDNPGDAKLAKEYIEETGYDVNITTIEDGQKAIYHFDEVNKCAKDRPDLVLMDLNLPKRNGHEVLDHIRRLGGDVKVIIYSGSRSPEDARRAEENHVDGYLVKPMNAREMDEVIRDLKVILRDLGASPISSI